MSVDPQMRVFRILVLEDDDAFLYLLRRALKNAHLNFELIVFGDGAAALAFIQELKNKSKQLPLDLVVLDLNVPKKSGWDVIKVLRLDRDFPHIPVAVITASSLAEDKTRMEELGADRYLIKPADLESYAYIASELRELLTQNEGGC